MAAKSKLEKRFFDPPDDTNTVVLLVLLSSDEIATRWPDASGYAETARRLAVCDALSATAAGRGWRTNDDRAETAVGCD